MDFRGNPNPELSAVVLLGLRLRNVLARIAHVLDGLRDEAPDSLEGGIRGRGQPGQRGEFSTQTHMLAVFRRPGDAIE